MNLAVIIGNLGADPDVRDAGDGKVANLRVATAEYYGGEEHTEWHRVVIWGPQADACGKFLSKGSKVAVHGSLQTRQWEDKDGVTHYTTEIRAIRVEFLTPKSADKGQTVTESRGRRGRRSRGGDDFPVSE